MSKYMGSIKLNPFTSILLLLSVIAGVLAGCSANNRDMPIEALKRYALQYPVAANQQEMNFVLPPLPGDVEEVVKHRKIDDEYKLYVSLILARHYRSHITNANQSYVINRSHPLWAAFAKYSNIELGSDYELSLVIFSWLDAHKNDLAPLLRVEYEVIIKELKRVGNF